VECQSHRLSIEDAPTPEYMASTIGGIQQKYTQRGGVRPFGIASLLAGFTPSAGPQLWHTDPTGVYSRWAVRELCSSCVPLPGAACAHHASNLDAHAHVHAHDRVVADSRVGLPPLVCWSCVGFRQANAVGRNSKSLREFLEERYKPDMSEEETVKLAIRTLMEVRLALHK
jgi:20S proteasome subunit alpha 4